MVLLTLILLTQNINHIINKKKLYTKFQNKHFSLLIFANIFFTNFPDFLHVFSQKIKSVFFSMCFSFLGYSFISLANAILNKIVNLLTPNFLIRGEFLPLFEHFKYHTLMACKPNNMFFDAAADLLKFLDNLVASSGFSTILAFSSISIFSVSSFTKNSSISSLISSLFF